LAIGYWLLGSDESLRAVTEQPIANSQQPIAPLQHLPPKRTFERRGSDAARTPLSALHFEDCGAGSYRSSRG
jgi:hypothetical protein